MSARRPTWALLREDELLYGRFILTLPGWHVDETDDERAARRRADTRWEEFILELVERGGRACGLARVEENNVKNIETSPVVADPESKVWSGALVEEGEAAHVAVVEREGQRVPLFFYEGKWREPAAHFGYRIMAAWANDRETVGNALSARLQEGVEIVEILVGGAREGWEIVKALSVAHGVQATERRAAIELAALAEVDGGKSAASLAHKAVGYVLQRAQEDADLGYVLGPMTEAFRLLCEAEAARLKVSAKEVQARRGKSLARQPRRFLSQEEWEAQSGDEKNCPQCDTVTTEPVCPECGMVFAEEPGDG